MRERFTAPLGGWSARLYYGLNRRALESRDRRVGILEAGLRDAFTGSRPDAIEEIYGGVERVLAMTGNDRLALVDRRWWSGYIHAVTAPASRYDECEQDLLSLTATLSPPALPASGWRELYRLCLVSGLYMVALEVRGKCISQAREEAASESAGLETLRLGFAVAIENNNAAEARVLLGRLQRAGELGLRVDHGLWLTELLCDGSRQLFPGGPDPAVDALIAALEGKRVALVGPVPALQENGPEIDAFDLVAKFNYRGGFAGCDPTTQGSRVDIAYYNIQQAKYIARKMDPGFLAALRFPVFIKEKGFRLLRNSTTAGRVLRNLQWLLLDSEFNAGPNAVFDLLRFGPAQIKVFNLDLMLTAGRFEGYARPGDGEINYSLSFAKTHDPVMQFLFLQKAWRQGLIDGDARFEQVLALSVEEYVRKLQEGHGEIAREALRGADSPS